MLHRSDCLEVGEDRSQIVVGEIAQILPGHPAFEIPHAAYLPGAHGLNEQIFVVVCDARRSGVIFGAIPPSARPAAQAIGHHPLVVRVDRRVTVRAHPDPRQYSPRRTGSSL